MLLIMGFRNAFKLETLQAEVFRSGLKKAAGSCRYVDVSSRGINPVLA